MQLEKATSHSSEAGLAGWISSNDVTLFTMVLVVIIALFLHANLIKGREDLASTTEELDETIGQRDTLDAHLRQRQQQLQQTQQRLESEQEASRRLEEQRQRLEAERQRLDRELAQSLDRIAALDNMIAGLTSEKSALQTSQADLQAAKSRLEGEKDDLIKKGATLTQEKTSLNQRLAAAAEQLEEKIQVLASLEKERDRLKEKADQLDGIVATLQKKLDTNDAELAAARAAADEHKARSVAQLRDLEQQVDVQAKRAEDYLARLRRAAELFKGMQAEKATLSQQLGDAEQRYQRRLQLETVVNRELVGLNGKLQRVAILFDASGSMREKGAGDEDRWAEAQKIATTWLGHLDVDQCVLIVFSSDVRTFPADGTLAKVRGPVGESNRAALMQQLAAVQPAGWTNTLQALRKAYEYQVDTILLFSDGAPTNPNSGRFDEQVAQQIYTLCRQHPDVPINSIGLGNYFDQSLSTFLRTVARLTGGTFRGR